MAAAIIHKSDRSVRHWRANLISSNRVISELNRVCIVELEYNGRIINLIRRPLNMLDFQRTKDLQT